MATTSIGHYLTYKDYSKTYSNIICNKTYTLLRIITISWRVIIGQFHGVGRTFRTL